MLSRFALLLSAALVLTGCAKKETATTSASGSDSPPRKVLRYGNGTEPQDIDPAIVTGTPEYRLLQTFFEGLVSEDPDMNIIPGVAERWELSPDLRTYTFYLRADAKWSDGEPVTAQDFVDSFHRILTPVLGSQYAYMLFNHVQGAKAYYDGKTTDFSTVGFSTPDKRTLIIKLVQPAPFFLHALNHYAWYPVPIATVKKFGGLTQRSTAWTRPENFVGNGPYVLKKWIPNQIIVAERSPTYWDRAGEN